MTAGSLKRLMVDFFYFLLGKNCIRMFFYPMLNTLNYILYLFVNK